MFNQSSDCITDCKERVASNALEKNHLQDVTVLAAEINRLLVRYSDMLKEGGIRKEMRQLEDWLETEKKGPAPAAIISASGLTWLCSIKDKLKLTADEALRLEGEGGQPMSKEQYEKTQELLKIVRKIDAIINESCAVAKPH